MAHYAELGVDNVVKRVLFIETKDCMTNGGIEKEEIGRAHLEEHHGGTWMKCSYNTISNLGTLSILFILYFFKVFYLIILLLSYQAMHHYYFLTKRRGNYNS